MPAMIVLINLREGVIPEKYERCMLTAVCSVVGLHPNRYRDRY